MRAGSHGVPTTSEWLNDVLSPGSKVRINSFLFSYDVAEELKEAMAKKSYKLVYLSNVNLVADIWKENRPEPPSTPVRVHDLKYAGLDVASKLTFLGYELKGAGSSAIGISMLAEIAWLLNLRGNDVPHSPVFYAYLVIDSSTTLLITETSKITPEVMDHLISAKVVLRPYELILTKIESQAVQGAKLWMDKSSSLAKAVKNNAELEGMRGAHLRDAAALAHFWIWLEGEVGKGLLVTEVDAADKLLQFRSEQFDFIDPSFDIICGSGPNGAIIHYRADTLHRPPAKPPDEHSVAANLLQPTSVLPHEVNSGMATGLIKLALEDPSFHSYRDEEINQTVIEGMGELHLEIIVDRFRREFKVEADVGALQVNYRESISKVAEVKYVHKNQSGGQGLDLKNLHQQKIQRRVPHFAP